MGALIELKNIGYSYHTLSGETGAIKDVSFQVEEGEFVAVLGHNGSGKSTVLDAMTYLLTGNTQFNKAAKDRDRTVIGYVRGDTKSNGTERYLRTGEVISYIAMEFWSPLDQSFLVVGVCMESDNEIACRSSWFICRDARIDEINFTSTEGKRIRFTPKNELAVRGEKLRSAEFLGKERGVEQVLRALGLRCNASKYRSRLLKMMAFNPENNIDQFIQDCVLEPGRVDSLKELREQRHQFDHIKEMYENLRSSKAQLETIEQRTGEYERKLRSLRIRELMLLYQDLREKEEEKKQEEIQNIRNGIGFAKKVLTTGECDLLILDEVLGLVEKDIITEDDLKALLECRGDTDVILTGITLNDEICVLADEVSKIETVKFKVWD